MSLLSVIVPCYNEEESVALFYRELTKNDPFFKEKEIELELLYIDDGSKDGTVREVKKLIEQDPRVHIISFSRNFGKEAAMFAGLKEKKYDIGFCSKFDDEPLIEFIPVAKQDLVVIVPPEHPLAEKSEIHLEETLPYKQIIFKKRSGLRQIIDQLFKSIGQYPDVAFEIDEDQVAAGFVANDFGICIAPDIPILHSLNLKILPLVSPSWQRNFYMAMLKDVYHPPVVEAFKKFVIEETSREIFYKTN